MDDRPMVGDSEADAPPAPAWAKQCGRQERPTGVGRRALLLWLAGVALGGPLPALVVRASADHDGGSDVGMLLLLLVGAATWLAIAAARLVYRAHDDRLVATLVFVTAPVASWLLAACIAQI